MFSPPAQTGGLFFLALRFRHDLARRDTRTE
jgi:hypothetical protein